MKLMINLVFCLAAVIGMWAGIACIAGILTAGGLMPFLASWMTASGLIGNITIMTNLFTLTKGVEYILILAFLGAVPWITKQSKNTKEVKPIRVESV